MHEMRSPASLCRIRRETDCPPDRIRAVHEGDRPGCARALTCLHGSVLQSQLKRGASKMQEPVAARKKKVAASLGIIAERTAISRAGGIGWGVGFWEKTVQASFAGFLSDAGPTLRGGNGNAIGMAGSSMRNVAPPSGTVVTGNFTALVVHEPVMNGLGPDLCLFPQALSCKTDRRRDAAREFPGLCRK